MKIHMKTTGQIVGEAIAQLQENTSITNFSPGGIARSLIEIIATELGDLYHTIEFKSLMANISTAQGPYLDLIGVGANVSRLLSESDDNFRYRIIHAGETRNQSNAIAQRLAILSIDNVRDVHTMLYTYGAGSRTIKVDVENPAYEQQTIDEVRVLVENTQAEGIKTVVLSPRKAYVDMEIRLITSAEGSKSSVAGAAAKAVETYLFSLPLGGTLVISEVIHRIKSVDHSVRDIQLISLSVDGKRVPFSNYMSKIDQRLWPRAIRVI